MKKILSFLAISVLLSTSTTNLVSCSSDTSDPVDPIVPPEVPLREYNIDYTFESTTPSFDSDTDFTVDYNTASPKGLYLEDGDQIQMTWDWDSGAIVYTFVVSLGAELTPDTTSTAWKLTLNQNNFSVSHLKADADQCTIKVRGPIVVPVTIDYSFEPDGSADPWWIAGGSHIVQYNTADPNDLKLKNGDQVQITFIWTKEHDGSIGFTFLNTIDTSLSIYPDKINYSNWRLNLKDDNMVMRETPYDTASMVIGVIPPEEPNE